MYVCVYWCAWVFMCECELICWWLEKARDFLEQHYHIYLWHILDECFRSVNDWLKGVFGIKPNKIVPVLMGANQFLAFIKSTSSPSIFGMMVIATSTGAISATTKR